MRFTNSFSLAIIGAGIGGSSSAHFLRNKFGETVEEGEEDVEISVFESGIVGGRLATVEIGGHTYEAGGSVIHPANVEMISLVKELGNCSVYSVPIDQLKHFHSLYLLD